jgi:hypothetical protein
MATTYVVLWEHLHGNEPDGATDYIILGEVEAANAEQARRRVANNGMSNAPAAELESDEGVTLIAVPARNWTSGRGTLKAETQRRIRSA